MLHRRRRLSLPSYGRPSPIGCPRAPRPLPEPQLLVLGSCRGVSGQKRVPAAAQGLPRKSATTHSLPKVCELLLRHVGKSARGARRGRQGGTLRGLGTRWWGQRARGCFCDGSAGEAAQRGKELRGGPHPTEGAEGRGGAGKGNPAAGAASGAQAGVTSRGPAHPASPALSTEHRAPGGGADPQGPAPAALRGAWASGLSRPQPDSGLGASRVLGSSRPPPLPKGQATPQSTVLSGRPHITGPGVTDLSRSSHSHTARAAPPTRVSAGGGADPRPLLPPPSRSGTTRRGRLQASGCRTAG